MNLEALTMNEAKDRPCSFCGQPITDPEKGYSVERKEKDVLVYHNSDGRHCYRESQKQNGHGNPQHFH